MPRVVEIDGLRKGAWAAEEDDLLLRLVRKHGTANWSAVCRGIPGRTGKSCRLRWHNQLHPGIKKEPFTAEEDAVIVQAVLQIGHKWAEIAKLLPGRTDNSVKNHFNGTLRKHKYYVVHPVPLRAAAAVLATQPAASAAAATSTSSLPPAHAPEDAPCSSTAVCTNGVPVLRPQPAGGLHHHLATIGGSGDGVSAPTAAASEPVGLSSVGSVQAPGDAVQHAAAQRQHPCAASDSVSDAAAAAATVLHGQLRDSYAPLVVPRTGHDVDTSPLASLTEQQPQANQLLRQLLQLRHASLVNGSAAPAAQDRGVPQPPPAAPSPASAAAPALDLAQFSMPVPWGVSLELQAHVAMLVQQFCARQGLGSVAAQPSAPQPRPAGELVTQPPSLASQPSTPAQLPPPAALPEAALPGRARGVLPPQGAPPQGAPTQGAPPQGACGSAQRASLFAASSCSTSSAALSHLPPYLNLRLLGDGPGGRFDPLVPGSGGALDGGAGGSRAAGAAASLATSSLDGDDNTNCSGAGAALCGGRPSSDACSAHAAVDTAAAAAAAAAMMWDADSFLCDVDLMYNFPEDFMDDVHR